MNVKEAAKLLKVSGARVRQMLLSGKLAGTKHNRDWVVTPGAVRARQKASPKLREKYGPKGEKPKRKPRKARVAA
jgi:hypothetical protein